MEFRVKLSDKANNDFQNILNFYEPIREGLGFEVQDEVLTYLDSLKNDAYIYQKRIEEVRSCFTKRFHFGIFYFIDETEKIIRVIGIINTKEDIQKIKNRYKK